ncbi:kanamycin nucleotidyltransferase C-terminal domain-containing protein [Paenibacillus ihbetae]|uniref:kanamycin nucleotidyltransferase C-terminal domain-containing protein n=1 Tax=Paenibacillus ihbetae TaxID=1870820 RepID=UPI003AB00FCF
MFLTGSMVLSEAMKLTGRPEGFDNVLRMVMSGELSIPSRVISASNISGMAL